MSAQPSVWLLLSDKQGDNKQAQALAELMGCACTVKRIYPKARFVLGKPYFRATVSHLDPERSDQLCPPWPDFLITIGRRPGMAALWIRGQSGNRTRIIMIGRQPRHLDRFALVISSCQYITARDSRILRIALPLDPSASLPTSAAPPTQATAVLIGGPTRTYRLTPADARALLQAAQRHAGDAPLLILSSRRTPADVLAWIADNLPPRARLLAWTPGRPQGSSDYQQTLADCARFIVTGDSISMICDVVRIARPLAIFRLRYRNALIRLWHETVLAVAPIDDGRERNSLPARLLRWIVDHRLLRLPRSFDAFYAYLFQHRSASDIEQGFLDHYQPMPEQDRRLVAERITQLLTENGFTASQS